MKDKVVGFLQTIRDKIVAYVLTSKLFISYVILAVLQMGLLRYFTLGEFFTLRSFLANFGIVVILGALGYFVKASNRFNYLLILTIIVSAMCTVNAIYYKFYTSFASFGELATAGQADTVLGSLFDKLSIFDFTFILIPFVFYFVHRKLKKSSYYNFINMIEKSTKNIMGTLLVGLGCLVFVFATSNATDYSRLAKQWNRVINVERFGIFVYQLNDLVQTLTPRFSSLFGYDEAALKFNEYYDNKPASEPNEFTGIFEGKNVLFIHMESIQSFLTGMSFNGEEVMPYFNDLKEEGMYFSNFYPQISTGTSSDSEFSLLSSLFPASSGTVFVSYFDRYYETVPKILSEKNYHSFSMHGNNFSMWNRSNAHPSLGYDDFYYVDKYEYEEEDVVGLGINDAMFFDQSFDYLVEIENTYPNYMGTIITLSNHSPFEDVSRYSEYDISHTYEEINEDGNVETITSDYLSGKSVGRYIKSSHYADQALGEFIEDIKNSENFNDTIFVFYGDHDAKYSQKDLNYLYNYDPKTGDLKDEDDETYIEYDSFDHEINKSTPLLIWTKDEELREKINMEIDYPVGMVDVSPTILNMMGEENPYALGNDIFNIKENNYIIFPNANFLTKDIYYNNSTGEYKALHDQVILSDTFIEDMLTIVDEKLEISNSIVVHDLILKEDINKKEEE